MPCPFIYRYGLRVNAQGERPWSGSRLLVEDAHAVATAVDDEGAARPCVYCYVDGIHSHGHGAPLANPAAHVEHAHCAVLIIGDHGSSAARVYQQPKRVPAHGHKT